MAPTRQLATNRPLSALVLANGISAVGDWLYLTIIPVLVYRETHDPALVGLVAAARLLPWLLLSIPAGIVADRVSRRHLLLVAEAGRATLMLLMAALLVVGAPLWMTLAAALAGVTAGTFAIPAQGTLVPELARDEAELGTANVLSSTLDNLACIIGPALAGIFVVLGGMEIAIAINGLSFLVVVVVLVGLVKCGTPGEDGESQAASGTARPSPGSSGGWLHIARKAIRTLAMDAAISFAAGALFILPILLAASMPGDADLLVGILSTSAGIGGLVGAVVAGAFVNGRLRQGLVIGVVIAVGSLAVLAASTAAVIVAVALALAAAAIVQLDALNMTHLQRSTESTRLGRTLGVLHTLAAGWVMAGSVVAGVLSETVGVQFAVATCVVVVAALGGAALWRQERAHGGNVHGAPAFASAAGQH